MTAGRAQSFLTCVNGRRLLFLAGSAALHAAGLAALIFLGFRSTPHGAAVGAVAVELVSTAPVSPAASPESGTSFQRLETALGSQVPSPAAVAVEPRTTLSELLREAAVSPASGGATGPAAAAGANGDVDRWARASYTPAAQTKLDPRCADPAFALSAPWRDRCRTRAGG